MCLIAWSWRVHPDYPLVVLANRDERHARPCEAAHWWPGAHPILAGRDQEAGGTWLGLDRRERFAALTNRRGGKPPDAPSRGELPVAFLQGEHTAYQMSDDLAPRAGEYGGFNLLLFDGERLVLASNREPARRLAPGIYAMANGPLDEPIPKVEKLRTLLAHWARAGGQPELERWLEVLADAQPLAGDDRLSAIFVHWNIYGTRASTLVLFDTEGHVHFVERGYDADGNLRQTVRFDYERLP